MRRKLIRVSAFAVGLKLSRSGLKLSRCDLFNCIKCIIDDDSYAFQRYKLSFLKENNNNKKDSNDHNGPDIPYCSSPQSLCVLLFVFMSFFSFCFRCFCSPLQIVLTEYVPLMFRKQGHNLFPT